jgi:hypothetical protein
MPNYLGSHTGLTGIPSALPSTLEQIQDPAAKRAIYQLQNWANSFLIFNQGRFSGNYITGGVRVTYANMYSTAAVPTATSAGISFATSCTIDNSDTTGFDLLFWVGATELANGAPCAAFWQAFGS